jgi:hypothetical protein
LEGLLGLTPAICFRHIAFERLGSRVWTNQDQILAGLHTEDWCRLYSLIRYDKEKDRNALFVYVTDADINGDPIIPRTSRRRASVV